MRKTTQYFTGKLELLHETNTIEWLDVQFHQTKGKGNNESQNWKPRGYFHYASRQEIDCKMMMGEALFAFTFHGNPKKIIVSFGDRRQKDFMNIIGITRFDIGTA